MSHLTEDGIRKDIEARTPDATEAIERTEPFGFWTTAEFEQSIKVDVERLRGAKVLAGMDIRGLAFDTESGLVRDLEV